MYFVFFFLDAHCRHIFQCSLLLLDLKYFSYFFSSSLFCVFIFIFIYSFIYSNRIGGVMFNVLASSAVDRGFKPRLGQTKDYQIGICCFSAKHATLRRKSKDWFSLNLYNVSEWTDMSTRRQLFQ